LRKIKKFYVFAVFLLLFCFFVGLTPLPAARAASPFILSSTGRTETTISLIWTQSSDALFYYYDVFMSSVGSNGPWTKVWTSDSTNSHNSVAISGLTPDSTYWFYVEDHGLAVDYNSNTIQASTCTIPLLSVAAQTATTASLTWVDYNTYSPLVPFSGYTIQMSTSSSNGPWLTLTTIANPSQTTYTVIGLSIGMFYFRIFDTVGGGSSIPAASSFSNVVVIPIISVGITPNTPTTITQGQSLQFSAIASGGIGSYTYQWYSNGNPITGATAPSYTLNPAWGTYGIYVTIQDAQYSAVTATSTTTLVTVWPTQLTVTLGSNYNAATLGGQILFTAAVTGGTGSYSYGWFVNNVKASAVTPTFSLSPSILGNYSVFATVSDTISSIVVPVSTGIKTVSFVNPLAVTLGASSSTVTLGGLIQFTTNTTGGTGSFTYNWYVNNVKQSATTSTFTLTPSQTGNYNVYVTVNDTASAAITPATSNVTTISVTSSNASPSPPPMTPTPMPTTVSPSPTTNPTTPPTPTPAPPTPTMTTTPKPTTTTPTQTPTQTSTSSPKPEQHNEGVNIPLVEIAAIIAITIAIVVGVIVFLTKRKNTLPNKELP